MALVSTESMRRKSSPNPIARASVVRPLRPATIASWLPTAASIAAVIAGCSTPTIETIGADPATTPNKIESPPPAPSPAPSPYLDPEPYELEGKIANVKPTPVPSTTPSVKKK